MIKRICLVFIVMLLLSGCSGVRKTVTVSGTEPTPTIETKHDSVSKEPDKPQDTGFSFKYKDVTINMNDKASGIIDRLGKPTDYFEAKSCAFEGLDKIYYYGGFELHTYPVDGVDYVASVLFTDDSVSTPDNICIGSSFDDVKKAYGDNYKKEESGAYTYTLGKSKLSFIIEKNEVSSIEFIAIVDKK